MAIHVAYSYSGNSSARKFIEQALELAEFSNCRKRHGCVIVQQGRPVARGWNKHRNDPSQVSPEHVQAGCSVHAEIVALKAGANQVLRGSTLYVARLGANGPLMSRPCDRCYKAIIEAGVSEIYHT